jgi:photosystem II stability/assembly factor-like uncharacterized protein
MRKMLLPAGLVAFLLLLLLSFAPAARAHVVSGQWFSHGPDKGVYAVAVDPVNTNNVYAGTTDGVYKSTDGGESWAPSNNGIPVANVNDVVTVLALAIDPQNSNIIYAGVNQAGNSNPATQLFKSINGGGTWASTGLPEVQSGVMAIALDPTSVGIPGSQRTLYVGATGSSDNITIGVYKSTNGGLSFVQINNGLGNKDIRALAIVRGSPNIVYAGTAFGGVFKSTNGGTDWSAARNGLPVSGPPNFHAVRSLLLHPTVASTVYAATNGGGVYKSTDGGVNWLGQNAGLTDNQGTSLAINPTTPDTLYVGTSGGGVFKSANGAVSWSAFNNFLGSINIQSLAIDPVTPTTLYAGATGPGVWRINQAAAPAITLSPSSLPPGTVGVAYIPNILGPTITAIGGTAPYNFTVTSGSLPTGLALALGGLIDGVPSVSGLFAFTVTATDASGGTGSRDYTITINAAPIVISPSSLPDGTVGVFYSQQLFAVGGIPPYTWAEVTALSPGLSLSSGGLVSGTPTQSGPSSFTVRATDSLGQSATKLYSLSMAAPVSPLLITTLLLPGGTLGVPYSQTLLATGGTPPLLWFVHLGLLPSELVLAPSTGQISGTPTQVQSATFTIQVADFTAATATRQYTVAITRPTITLSPPSLPNGTEGVAYSQTITASGGTTPHTFAVTAGQLPPGLGTSPGSLVISGTPTQSGSFSFTLTATDALLNTGSQAYTITVNAPAPPAFSFPEALPLPGTEACICTPPLMLAADSHIVNWFAKASGSNMTVSLTTSSHDPNERGSIKLDVFDTTSGSSVFSAPVQLIPSHPDAPNAPLNAALPPDIVQAYTFGTNSDTIYRVRLTLILPSEGRVAYHYQLKFQHASRIGQNSPTQPNIEPVAAGGPDVARWFVAVGSGEPVEVRVFSPVQPTPGAPNNSGPFPQNTVTATVQLRDPSGAVRDAETLTWAFDATGSANGIVLSSSAGPSPAGPAGLWSVELLSSDGHYQVEKLGGVDTGVYATWLTTGSGTIAANVTFNGEPNNVPVTVRITNLGTGEHTDVLEVSTSLTVPNLPVGEYKIEVIDGIGASHRPSPVTISLTCDETETVTLNLLNQPPAATFAAVTPIKQGQTTTLTFSSPSDPNSEDAAAGFRYSFACDGLEGSLASTYAAAQAPPAAPLPNTVICTLSTAGNLEVRGRIFDQYNGSTTYQATVVVIPLLEQAWITDSQFQLINSADVVFASDKATSSQKLTATNPGTYYFNKALTNTGSSPLTVSVTVAIPSSLSLKGSMPVHVYADLLRTLDVTSQATISVAQPLGSANATSLTYVPNVTVSVTIPAGELRYLNIHLDYNLKGTTGYPSSSQTTYVQGLKFVETVTVATFGAVPNDAVGMTFVGKRVTAVGGIALDTNANFKSGLNVRVKDASNQTIVTVQVTAPDGFYFSAIPAGGAYTLELYNAVGTVRTATVQSVAQDQYVQADFLNINPADPLVEGFVVDTNGKAVAGVKVELYTAQAKLMATATSSGSGWYAFRFSRVGTFTVKVVPPAGYTADQPTATVTLKQFDEVRLDFVLKR